MRIQADQRKRASWRTTVTESVICCLVAPLVADTVTEYTPALALLVAVSLSTLPPDPGGDRVAGLKAAETPLGNPVIEKATAALKPPLIVTFSVMLSFDPRFDPRFDPAVTESALADGVA
jgi:hypothetical protein